MAAKLEGMNLSGGFFYHDEIGMAKWQGEPHSSFPPGPR
jgi:hypothetical protein